MKKIKLAIIGAGREGSALYYCFKMKPNVKIAGIADVTCQGLGTDDAAREGVLVSSSLEEVLAIEGLDVIVETTKIPEIAQKVHSLKNSQTKVIEAESLDLILSLEENKTKLEAQLFSLTGSVNDAIIIIDRDGTVTYINNAFEKLTGIEGQEILGFNIQEKYPDCPLVHTLRNGEKIYGQKYSFDNRKEFSYNIMPIMVRNNLVGVIGVFRVFPDIVRLMEELQRSTSIIEGLYDKLGQINGLSELNISDVMPIDKMEQILMRQALTKYGYSVEGKKKAAKALNISLATLYNKLKKYQIS